MTVIPRVDLLSWAAFIVSMSTCQLSRDQAFQIVLEKIGPGNLMKHILAVEAGMHSLATRFGEDPELWGLVGLIHDTDYHQTAQDESRHGYLTCQWLAEHGLTQEMQQAIIAHPGHVPCQSQLDWALYATDPATGFIVACALMHPSKRLDQIDQEFMLRRFKEKRFAAGASRDNMAACSELGLSLEDFLGLIHQSMLSIRDELGL